MKDGIRLICRGKATPASRLVPIGINMVDRMSEVDEYGFQQFQVAHTWHEETVYKIELPANRLAQWAALEVERFSHPVFRLFQTELETVYEEMNRALDNKDRIIRYAVEGQLYKTHPYGQQPTLGKVEHLKNPSLENIGKYYKPYYVPNNMAIFLSGDLKKEEAMAIIDQAFSAWTPGEVPAAQTWEEAPLQGREEVVTTYEGEEFVLLAFRTASNKSADYEALTLIDMILVNSAAGLINLNLNQQQRSCARRDRIPVFTTMTVSADGASGWSTPKFDDALLEPICMASIGRYSTKPAGDKNRILFANPHNLTRLDGKEEEGKTRDRKNISIKVSYDEGETWEVNKVLEPSYSAYSDLAVLPDGTILCLYETGRKSDTEKKKSTSYAGLTLARFNMEWVTDGRDVPQASTSAQPSTK